jgi:transcriptional regulator with XRE-family HTH domain
MPEVAALATELTKLFKGLEIPQQQYAVRVTMDKSTVSRYLNGRRVPTQDFIDRLFVEIERHRGVAITPEARLSIQRMRMTALKLTDPQAFELEDLRDQVDRSHRRVKQLLRQQEALELLLDRKEEDAKKYKNQLELLRGDWIADNIELETSALEVSAENKRIKEEKQNLQQEIKDLKLQLSELMERRIDAEERCTELEDRLAQAEVALAEHLAKQPDSSFPFTPKDVAHIAFEAYSDERFHDAARMLSLAAAHFSPKDIVGLFSLIEHKKPVDAMRLLDDAIRFGSIASSAKIAETVVGGWSTRTSWLYGNVPELLAASIANSKSAAELKQLYELWGNGGPYYTILLSKSLVLWSENANPSAVYDFLTMLRKRKDTTIAVRILHKYGERSERDVAMLVYLHREAGLNDEVTILTYRWASLNLPGDPNSERTIRRAAGRLRRTYSALRPNLWR